MVDVLYATKSPQLTLLRVAPLHTQPGFVRDGRRAVGHITTANPSTSGSLARTTWIRAWLMTEVLYATSPQLTLLWVAPLHAQLGFVRDGRRAVGHITTANPSTNGSLARTTWALCEKGDVLYVTTLPPPLTQPTPQRFGPVHAQPWTRARWQTCWTLPHCHCLG